MADRRDIEQDAACGVNGDGDRGRAVAMDRSAATPIAERTLYPTLQP